MKHLASLQEQLKESLVNDGIAAPIKSLRQQLPETSPKFNALLQIHASFKELESNMVKGLFALDQINIELNKIRNQLIGLIDSLEASDFDRSTRRSRFAADQKIRRGHVLYQIPKQMQVFEESRCRVRIAFDKASLLEDLKLDQNTEIRDNIRLSEWMKVTIIDPAATPAFEVRTTSEAEQLIDEDDFTEWRFYVKPLVPGEHILELKVVIMVVTESGGIKPREKVLEETVVIVNEPTEVKETSFQTLETDLLLGGGVEAAARGDSGFRLPKSVQALSTILLLIFCSGTIAYAVAPAEMDWLNTRYLQDTKVAYQGYIEKYAEIAAPRVEDATFHKARVTEDANAYAKYVEQYEEGKFVEEASWQIAKITQEPEAFIQYIYKFPDTIREHIVSERIKIAKQTLTNLEPELRETALQAENLIAIDRYLQIYPNSKHKDMILQRLDDPLLWQIPVENVPAILPSHPSSLTERLLTYTEEQNTVTSFQHFIEAVSDSNLQVKAQQELDRRTEDRTIDKDKIFERSSENTEHNSLTENPTSPREKKTAGKDETDLVTNYEKFDSNTVEKTSITQNIPSMGWPRIEKLQDKSVVKEAQKQQFESTTLNGQNAVGADSSLTAKGGSDVTKDAATKTDIEAKSLSSPSPSPDQMVFVQGGTFEMGDVWGNGNSSEKPVHTVTINSYYISRYEVTLKEYDAFCLATGRDLAHNERWGGPKIPVVNVSWYDAIEYCNWRSEHEQLEKVYSIDKSMKDPNNMDDSDNLKWMITVNWSANGYRLPTEAEWEYAARSRGGKIKWAGTSDEANLHSYSNHYDRVYNGMRDAFEFASPIGSFRANGLGIFDLSGNVSEWCWDWYDSNYYAKSPNTNPFGPNSGSYRVLRGGSWRHLPTRLRSINRNQAFPADYYDFVGFRISRSVH